MAGRGVETAEKENKMMLEVLNVEMPRQGAIRWKGIHVKKRREKKGLTNRRAKKVRRKGGGGAILSPNIRYSAILFTDKRTWKNLFRLNMYVKRGMSGLYKVQSEGNITIDLLHLSIFYAVVYTKGML